ncbi:hypothetical protein BV22DRAFT_1014654 [Leucogyrophana mollusca]|uniref:Uncharacterized protein n=1 Tax=Leucogyrophana mollusca TaxID=85980 RepID=A0ACB8BE42_9AGAM|nr:hypothetical protein BV22DRAFT_1014654 [Leucogyrophana mollusca]
MHTIAASSFSCTLSASSPSQSESSSSSTNSSHNHCARHSNATPVSTRNSSNDADAFVNHNAPQCCHCGWRGSHSPSCPFR